MMIRYECQHCGTTLESPSEMAGKEDQCPLCRQMCTVPQKQDKSRNILYFLLAIAGGVIIVLVVIIVLLLGNNKAFDTIPDTKDPVEMSRAKDEPPNAQRRDTKRNTKKTSPKKLVQKPSSKPVSMSKPAPQIADKSSPLTAATYLRPPHFTAPKGRYYNPDMNERPLPDQLHSKYSRLCYSVVRPDATNWEKTYKEHVSTENECVVMLRLLSDTRLVGDGVYIDAVYNKINWTVDAYGNRPKRQFPAYLRLYLYGNGMPQADLLTKYGKPRLIHKTPYNTLITYGNVTIVYGPENAFWGVSFFYQPTHTEPEKAQKDSQPSPGTNESASKPELSISVPAWETKTVDHEETQIQKLNDMVMTPHGPAHKTGTRTTITPYTIYQGVVTITNSTKNPKTISLSIDNDTQQSLDQLSLSQSRLPVPVGGWGYWKITPNKITVPARSTKKVNIQLGARKFWYEYANAKKRSELDTICAATRIVSVSSKTTPNETPKLKEAPTTKREEEEARQQKEEEVKTALTEIDSAADTAESNNSLTTRQFLRKALYQLDYATLDYSGDNDAVDAARSRARKILVGVAESGNQTITEALHKRNPGFFRFGDRNQAVRSGILGLNPPIRGLYLYTEDMARLMSSVDNAVLAGGINTSTFKARASISPDGELGWLVEVLRSNYPLAGRHGKLVVEFSEHPSARNVVVINSVSGE
ncbi:MAG: hypothetical protein JW849_02495 [Phycisphaerae bacterium]|nr:hypothetical protein [Phycisphaerae bacterium]